MENFNFSINKRKIVKKYNNVDYNSLQKMTQIGSSTIFSLIIVGGGITSFIIFTLQLGYFIMDDLLIEKNLPQTVEYYPNLPLLKEKEKEKEKIFLLSKKVQYLENEFKILQEEVKKTSMEKNKNEPKAELSK